jgi:hypothetical protein
VFGGAGHEEKLGPFAALFEMIDDVGGVVWHWGPLYEFRKKQVLCG